MLKVLFIIFSSILVTLIAIFLLIEVNLSNEFLKGRILECKESNIILKSRLSAMEQKTNYCIYTKSQLDISTVYED